MNVITPQGHALGWDPVRSALAQANLLASGRYCTVSPSAPKPPPAWSLSDKRLRHLEQYSAGECWGHSAVQLAETSANALGYRPFPVSRWLVGWAGKQFEGGGSPGDGGDPTDALRAMTADGPGVAHESLAPYLSADLDVESASAYLAVRPPQAAFADAKACHLVAPVVVDSDDQARVLIASGHGCCNGIWWPFGWDNAHTLFETIGQGAYGHSLYEIGYVSKGVWPGRYGSYDWWQLDNWHGLLYPPLPAAYAALVPGYRPITAAKTSDFWVRGDVYRRVQAMGSFVRVSATDMSGFDRDVVVPSADGALIF